MEIEDIISNLINGKNMRKNINLKEYKNGEKRNREKADNNPNIYVITIERKD